MSKHMMELENIANKATSAIEDYLNGYDCFTDVETIILNVLKEAIKSSQQAAPDQAGEPVAWQDIVSALKAVDAEAWERGRMFPQHSDEQGADRAAIRRACELIEWYATKGGSVAMHLPLWPKHPVSAQSIPEGWQPMINFLLGEDMLDGLWFGEVSRTEPTEPYWWREELRRLASAAPSE